MIEPAVIRDWLRHWQFWILEGQFVALAALTWLNLPVLWRLARPSPSSIAGGAAASLLALVLATSVAPQTSRIYYDEHIYQAAAQNMAELHLAQVCNDGEIAYGRLSCVRGEYNKEPYGYPYLLSIPYRVFGVSDTWAHGVNALCAIAMVWVVFLTGMLLFGDGIAAALAAFIMALMPQQALWSSTAAAEPSAALMAAFAVMTAIVFARQPSWISMAWTGVAIVFASQFRMEVALVVPVSLVALLVYRSPALHLSKIAGLAALGVVLGAPHLAHLIAVWSESWGSSGERFSLSYFWSNVSVNAAFYLGDSRFPVLFTALAAAGVFTRRNRVVVVPLVAFALFWGIFVFFYAGSYDFGADVRFSLMSNAWLALLAGRGLSALVTAAGAAWNNVHRAIAAGVVALLVQFTWYLPQVRAVGDEAWAAREDVAFAKALLPSLPPHSVVLTQNPSIFHLNGVSAAQMSLARDEPYYVNGVLAHRFTGGVYLHWNAWCGYHDDVQRELCASTLKTFDSELVAEHRVRDFRYAFYRLRTAGTIPKTTP